jgi:hypothetical protein
VAQGIEAQMLTGKIPWHSPLLEMPWMPVKALGFRQISSAMIITCWYRVSLRRNAPTEINPEVHIYSRPDCSHI